MIIDHAKRKAGRAGAGVALAAVLLLTASACTAPPVDENTSGATESTVTVADSGELCGLNIMSRGCPIQINSTVDYLTNGYFVRTDPDGNLMRDESFGTVELLSDEPMRVKYTINEGVLWSDGVQVAADDMILATLARTAYYNDLTADESSGTAFFGYAPDGMYLAAFPEVGDDGRSMTIEYASPYADWEIYNPISVAAHVVATKTGVSEPGDAFINLLASIPQGDSTAPVATNADIQKISSFWSDDYTVSSLPDDPAMYVSNGPYTIDSWTTGQSVTLKRSETYTGELKPQYDRMVIRFIGDSTAQVQALKNGEVDIITPQASADTLSALEQVPNATIETGTSSSFDLLQLNFASEVFTDPDVREAFLKVIPREALTDAIIRPLNADAKLMQSFMFAPGTAAYDESLKTNGADQFAAVDIAGAKALLNGRTPTIRLGYNLANPNRVDSFLAIQATAAEAGFIVVDGGQSADKWVAALYQTDSWDAFMWGSWNDPVGVENVPSTWRSGGSINVSGWVSPEMDALSDELVQTADKARQTEILTEMDKIAFDAGYGLPLYNLVGVEAYGPKVTGIKYNPWILASYWNFWEWAPAA